MTSPGQLRDRSSHGSDPLYSQQFNTVVEVATRQCSERYQIESKKSSSTGIRSTRDCENASSVWS